MAESATSVDHVDPERGARRLRPTRVVSAGAWLGSVVLALVDAVLRETLVAPRFGDYRTRVTSTATHLAGLTASVHRYFARFREHTAFELGVIGIRGPG